MGLTARETAEQIVERYPRDEQYPAAWGWLRGHLLDRAWASEPEILAWAVAFLEEFPRARMRASAARVRESIADATGVAWFLSGCDCGGIGDTGSHRPGCPWAA